MTKIILFNGPPRSGKDTATRMALSMLGDKGAFYRFAEPLKDAVHAMIGYAGVNCEHFNNVKNEVSKEFFGMSPRQMYIWLSEEVLKPKFGKDYFARIAVTKIKQMAQDVVVIADCGFVSECQALGEEFGFENVHVVHMHRNGCSFAGDSRNYIWTSERQWTQIIENNGTLGMLERDVIKLLGSIERGE